ncbi:MAG: rhodanese-like domain-containing protein [Ottowia sp.]|nr:rhodanese-like domain-containing protein [Ottowia sp.]
MHFFYDSTNLMLMVLALLAGGLLAWPALTRKRTTLPAAQVTHLINKNNAIVIDVRTDSAFAQGHLPHAKHIPLDQLASKVAHLARDKNTPLVVVCQTGVQSARAVNTIKQAGYTQVFDLEGGLFAWQKMGLPLATK